jgi:hypothetical protein
LGSPLAAAVESWRRTAVCRLTCREAAVTVRDKDIMVNDSCLISENGRSRRCCWDFVVFAFLGDLRAISSEGARTICERQEARET